MAWTAKAKAEKQLKRGWIVFPEMYRSIRL